MCSPLFAAEGAVALTVKVISWNDLLKMATFSTLTKACKF